MNDAIKKVVLQLGSKEIELTPDEAKKLHEALNELLGSKVVVEERHVHHEYPWRWTYTFPYYGTGVIVTPTYPTTTTPIWYNTSSGAQASMSDGTMTLSLNQ